MRHERLCESKYFDAISNGVLRFLVVDRKDEVFYPGDDLLLEDHDTGRELDCIVTYVLDEHHGLVLPSIVLGLEPKSLEE